MFEDNEACNADETPNALKTGMSPKISLLDIYKSSKDMPFPKAKNNLSADIEDESSILNPKISVPNKSRNDLTLREFRGTLLENQTSSVTKHTVVNADNDVKQLEQEIVRKYEIIAMLQNEIKDANRENKELLDQLTEASLLNLLSLASE